MGHRNRALARPIGTFSLSAPRASALFLALPPTTGPCPATAPHHLSVCHAGDGKLHRNATCGDG